MRGEWQGHYLDGRTAARETVVVRLMPSGIEIAMASGRTLWWPYGEVRQTQGAYAGEPVRLEHGGEIAEAVVVAESGFLVDLHRTAAGAVPRLHDPRRRRARVWLTLAAAIGAVAVAAALYLWAIPALAALLAARVPPAWEERLGRAAIEHLAPAATRCTGPDGVRALDGLLAALVRPLGPTPYTFRVAVVDDPKANAFAAPGGHLVILRGLVEHARTPEELAGVLAHEVQHVARRHATRALLQHASTGILAAALMGDASGVAVYGLEAARTLGTLRYSREHEIEADAEGVRLLVAAGVDPRGLVTFLESERTQPAGLPAYLSTHPSDADRIRRLRALAGSTARQAPVLEPDAWRAIQHICE